MNLLNVWGSARRCLQHRRWLLGVVSFGVCMAGCGDANGTTVCEAPLSIVATLGRVDDAVSVRRPEGARVVRWPAGGWVVLDRWGSVELLTYDSIGNFTGLLGKRGQGPDEFSRPATIAVDAADSLWVSDAGKVLVLNERGDVVRSLRSIGFNIDGFFQGSIPYSLLARRSTEAGDEVPPFPYIITRTRDGAPQRAFGPGIIDPRANGRTINVNSRATLMVTDSTALSNVVSPATSWQLAWIEYWAPRGSEIWLTRDTVWTALGRKEDLPSPAAFRNIALVQSARGGYLNLAVLENDDSSLETVLFRIDRQKRVRYVQSIANEQPLEFIDANHFATMRQSPDGLWIINIRRIPAECAT
jgi:hypothetical protein